MDIVVGIILKLRHLKKFLQTLFTLRFWNFSFFHGIENVLTHLQPWKKSVVLEYKGAVRTGLCHFPVIYKNFSAVPRLKTGYDGKRGCLSAAGGTQQGDEFPVPDFKTDV